MGKAAPDWRRAVREADRLASLPAAAQARALLRAAPYVPRRRLSELALSARSAGAPWAAAVAGALLEETRDRGVPRQEPAALAPSDATWLEAARRDALALRRPSAAPPPPEEEVPSQALEEPTPEAQVEVDEERVVAGVLAAAAAAGDALAAAGAGGEASVAVPPEVRAAVAAAGEDPAVLAALRLSDCAAEMLPALVRAVLGGDDVALARQRAFLAELLLPRIRALDAGLPRALAEALEEAVRLAPDAATPALLLPLLAGPPAAGAPQAEAASRAARGGLDGEGRVALLRDACEAAVAASAPLGEPAVQALQALLETKPPVDAAAVGALARAAALTAPALPGSMKVARLVHTLAGAHGALAAPHAESLAGAARAAGTFLAKATLGKLAKLS